MANVFEQLRQFITAAECEINDKQEDRLVLHPMPWGHCSLLRMVLEETGGFRLSGWHLNERTDIVIEKENTADVQELKKQLLESLDKIYQAFKNAITYNNEGTPTLIYENIEPHIRNVNLPEDTVEYTIINILRDLPFGKIKDCSVFSLFIPNRHIIAKSGSDAELQGFTETDLNTPKPASENETMIIAAGYSTGNDLPSDDYVGKKLYSVVFFGEGVPAFLDKLGLNEALMKKAQPAIPSLRVVPRQEYD
ncbi:MAG: hypothetical protein AAGB32_03240 [Pseudomonadota bacterium]